VNASQILTRRRSPHRFDCAPVPRNDAFHRGFIRLTHKRESRSTIGGSGSGRARIGGRRGCGSHYVVQDEKRHSLIRPTTRFYGCGSRRPHAWSAVWPKLWNFEESRAFATARAPPPARRRRYEIQRNTTRQRHEQQDRTYAGAHRPSPGGRRKRARGSREDPHDARQGHVRRISSENCAGRSKHFCGLGDRVHRSGTSVVCSLVSRWLPTRRFIHLRSPYRLSQTRQCAHARSRFGHKVLPRRKRRRA